MKIYPNTNSEVFNTLHPVYKFVVNEFDNWINDSNPASEYKDKYFGSFEELQGDSYLDYKVAVSDAIQEAINEANETGKPVDLKYFDFAAIFQD